MCPINDINNLREISYAEEISHALLSNMLGNRETDELSDNIYVCKGFSGLSEGPTSSLLHIYFFTGSKITQCYDDLHLQGGSGLFLLVSLDKASITRLVTYNIPSLFTLYLLISSAFEPVMHVPFPKRIPRLGMFL